MNIDFIVYAIGSHGYIQVQETKYVEGSVVVLDHWKSYQHFGVLHTECSFRYILLSEPIPNVFYKPDELSDHHTLGPYTL